MSLKFNLFQAYNVCLETYDLVQLEDVMSYLEKEFKNFRANERKAHGEEIYYKYFEGNLLYQ